MSRAMWRLVATSIVAFAVLASSCFWTIRFFRTVDQYLAAGDRTRIVMNLHPFDQTTSGTSEGYPFILVGYGPEMKQRQVMEFDRTGVWGGPWDGVLDTGLRDALLAPGACPSFGGAIDAEDLMGDYPLWRAYRTPVEIDNSGGVGLADLDKPMRTIHNVEAKATADPTTDLAGNVVIFSGGWLDTDNDKVLDVGEIRGCGGAVFINFPFVP